MLRFARDTDDIKALWETHWPYDDPFFTRDYRPERALIYTDNEKPVSMLHMLPRIIIDGNRQYSAGYIMGVLTHPDYRKRGLAGKLLCEALRLLEEQGYDCAILIPASPGLAAYYERFGFTAYGQQLTLEAPDGRAALPSDIPSLSAMYDAAFPCRVERTAFEWETILLEYEVSIYRDGYSVRDERGVLERLPSGPAMSLACIKPFTILHIEPYLNLIYT